jgi:plasmid replication initiation protein
MRKSCDLEKVETYEVVTTGQTEGDRCVNMSNALIRAGQGLSLAEKRLMASAVAMLDSMRTPLPGECPVVRITAADYAESFDLDIDTAYNQLQSGADNLYHRSIVIFEPSYKRGSKKIGDKGTVTRMRWVGRASYQEKEGWVELAFWHEVVPHLMGLRKQFTTYKLQQASALRSIYSWRLLELLMRFKDTGWAQYSIEDFCQSMNASEKQKADFAAIRRKIIEPAVKELIEKDGWLIEWKPIKAGRKVTDIRFTFLKNPQQQLQF